MGIQLFYLSTENLYVAFSNVLKRQLMFRKKEATIFTGSETNFAPPNFDIIDPPKDMSLRYRVFREIEQDEVNHAVFRVVVGIKNLMADKPLENYILVDKLSDEIKIMNWVDNPSAAQREKNWSTYYWLVDCLEPGKEKSFCYVVKGQVENEQKAKLSHGLYRLSLKTISQ